MDIHQIAQSWVNNGFSVIPIGWRSKRPAFDALRWTGCTIDTETGSQSSWEKFKHSAPTGDELRKLFAGPRRNLGVVTGYNGLVVLDFDQMDAYEAWSCWARGAGEQADHVLAHTYRVYSARGVHLYLIVDEPVESYKAPGIDVKARWGYVLAPPSVHPSGHIYRAEGESIVRVARLADVFPFEKQAPINQVMSAAAIATNDPYEAASRAVQCGGNGSVDAIKERIQITDLIVPVSQDSRGAWALCPLHGDTNPSLRIYPDGSWKCFGCEAYGDVIDLYAMMHHLSNREAIAELSR